MDTDPSTAHFHQNFMSNSEWSIGGPSIVWVALIWYLCHRWAPVIIRSQSRLDRSEHPIYPRCHENQRNYKLLSSATSAVRANNSCYIWLTFCNQSRWTSVFEIRSERWAKWKVPQAACWRIWSEFKRFQREKGMRYNILYECDSYICQRITSCRGWWTVQIQGHSESCHCACLLSTWLPYIHLRWWKKPVIYWCHNCWQFLMSDVHPCTVSPRYQSSVYRMPPSRDWPHSCWRRVDQNFLRQDVGTR